MRPQLRGLNLQRLPCFTGSGAAPDRDSSVVLINPKPGQKCAWDLPQPTAVPGAMC